MPTRGLIITNESFQKCIKLYLKGHKKYPWFDYNVQKTIPYSLPKYQNFNFNYALYQIPLEKKFNKGPPLKDQTNILECFDRTS